MVSVPPTGNIKTIILPVATYVSDVRSRRKVYCMIRCFSLRELIVQNGLTIPIRPAPPIPLCKLVHTFALRCKRVHGVDKFEG